MRLNFTLHNKEHFAVRISGKVPSILAIKVHVDSENNVIRSLGYIHRIVGH